jgi:polyribonucleotide nucleotidyltransferase
MELNMNEVRVEREIGGRTLSISTGLMAKQAAGAAVVQYADTVVLTAVSTAPPRFADADFFPLTVDYREKTYAAGKFPGGFFKREKAPSTKEILTMRLTDRPIRPLFPKSYRNEVVVQSIVLSADMVNEPDILSIIGAGAAITLSRLPFAGPVGAVRMGMDGGELVVNPTHDQMDRGTLNLVLAGTHDSVTMVEAGAHEIPEEKMVEAIDKGHEVVRTICEMITELCEKAGRTEDDLHEEPAPPACLDAVRAAAAEKLRDAVRTEGKEGRREAQSALADAIVEQLVDGENEDAPDEKEVRAAFHIVKTEVIRELITKGTRIDGRDLRTVRPIDSRVSVLPCTHGSSLFTRGETQALVAVTLGAQSDSQKVDGLREAYEERFYLHYQAPGFSVGEARMPRGPSRRDIGHGMLAQRAIEATIPEAEVFPYTIRAVSEVLEMNGSSSMATVCGSTLALMDAGVPVSRPVAGIAMGLIQESGAEPVIITDILGDEDHYGDMDFKVCGTNGGVTALQMDIKIKGISPETMRKALAQAREGRLHILDEMAKAIEKPREEISPRAPRLFSIHVDPDILGKVIGPGGKTIRGIQETSGARIDIDDSGEIAIMAPDQESLDQAAEMIRRLTEKPEIGKDYEGVVKSTRDFGAFVEILPGTEGMVHISEISDEYVENVEDAVKVGDPLKVKVTNIDDIGRIRLSRKAVILESRGETYEPEPARSGGGGRGGSGGGRREGGGGRRGGGRREGGGGGGRRR